MRKLGRNERKLVADDVLEEIELLKIYAAENCIQLNEKYCDAFSETLPFTDSEIIEGIINKYKDIYSLDSIFKRQNRIGKALHTDTLTFDGENHECEFRTIKLYNNPKHMSKMQFEFNNNGYIFLNYDLSKLVNEKNTVKISYKSEYNVDDNGFLLQIKIDKYDMPSDNITFSKTDSSVYAEYNNICFIVDLATGKKSIQLMNNEIIDINSIPVIYNDILNLVQNISNSLPLSGLTNRINNCLDLLDSKSNQLSMKKL